MYQRFALCFMIVFAFVWASADHEPLSNETNEVETIKFPTATATFARAVTPSGGVVGFYKGTDRREHGFRFEAGTFTVIDCPSSVETRVHDINSAGVIVGYCKHDDGKVVGFRKDERGFRYIVFPDAQFTSAITISDDDVIVGRYEVVAGESHSYLLHKGNFTNIDPPADLGLVGSAAMSTNIQGDIAGFYRVSASSIHGFLLRKGKYTVIDFPGAVQTEVYALDPAGNLVGHYVAGDNTVHGFRFVRKTGAFETVDVPGATSTRVFGISAKGELVGTYTAPDGTINGFFRKAAR